MYVVYVSLVGVQRNRFHCWKYVLICRGGVGRKLKFCKDFLDFQSTSEVIGEEPAFSFSVLGKWRSVRLCLFFTGYASLAGALSKK